MPIRPGPLSAWVRLRVGANPFISRPPLKAASPKKRFRFLLALASFGIPAVEVVVGSTSGADFDLYLLKWNGSAWVAVANGESATASETISYSGTSGYYMWQVYAHSGSGSYNFWTLHP